MCCSSAIGTSRFGLRYSPRRGRRVLEPRIGEQEEESRVREAPGRGGRLPAEHLEREADRSGDDEQAEWNELPDDEHHRRSHTRACSDQVECGEAEERTRDDDAPGPPLPQRRYPEGQRLGEAG